jgi:hypothetical protein
MPRRKSWPSVLFVFEEHQLKRVKHIRHISFHVGIWWHDNQRVVAFLQSIAEIKTTGHLVDSDLTHDSVWELARPEFSFQAGAEYFNVPRGRIIWDTVHQSGRLYHGNSTPTELLDELARIYRLPRWEAQLDEHYLTGDALEQFYWLDSR